MKKLLLTFAAVAFSAFSHAANTKTTYNVSVVRNVNKTEESTTRFQVNTDLLCQTFGRTDAEAINTGLKAGTIKLHGKQGSTDKTVTASTYGTYGFWFTAKGVVVAASSTSRRVACKYEDGYFKITHWADKAAMGDKYSFAEMFIQGKDTVQYIFDVTLLDYDKVTSDQPAYNETIKHRTDKVETWGVTPSVRQNDQTPLKQNYIQVMAGDRITLDCVLPEGANSARFSWKNRKGTSLATLSKTSEWVINSATPEDAGYYVLSGRYSLDGQTKSFSNCYFYVDVQTEKLGSPFSWEGRCPQFSHDWNTDAKYNYGKWTKPEKIHTIKKKNGQKANYVAGEWWSAFWGDNLNSACGDAATAKKAAENMVKKYDEDFAYIRDYMGWPPDMSARDGYKSFVYIFGSGLSNDNEANTTEGGYQGNTYVDGKGYACVWASFYPFSRFRDDADKLWKDGDYQREAMIHEGIHAIFADLNACNKSSWFHEAGNTWLQSAMNSERYDKQGTPGFLDACPFIAPFMPIECYSGWLLDGSFGGPTAEGVNLYGADGQICTWRNLLGGTQYGNAFPIILAEVCGKGSIPWIWRNCSDYVLKGIGNMLGDDVMRDMIQQYRSRMAIFDIGKWKTGYRSVTNGNFGVLCKEEYGNGVMVKDNKSSNVMPCSQHITPFKLTMYQGLTKNDNDYWLAPDTTTNPGWSGCNIIPIHVDSKANTATIEFRPEDTEMRAQLCYTTKAGKNYYSQPIQCGKTQIDITDRPANNVVFLVVCNTDWLYSNDNNQAQRKKHWDYRVRFGEGALQVADLYTKWNLNEQTLKDQNYDEDSAREENAIQQDYITDVTDVAIDGTYTPGQNGVRLVSGQCFAGSPIKTILSNGLTPSQVNVNILGVSGIIASNAPLNNDGTFTLPSNLTQGIYFVKFVTTLGKIDTYKIFVKTK